jgi:hypothetical protein
MQIRAQLDPLTAPRAIREREFFPIDGIVAQGSPWSMDFAASWELCPARWWRWEGGFPPKLFRHGRRSILLHFHCPLRTHRHTPHRPAPRSYSSDCPRRAQRTLKKAQADPTCASPPVIPPEQTPLLSDIPSQSQSSKPKFMHIITYAV